MIRSIQSRRSSAPRSRATGGSGKRSGTGQDAASTQVPVSRPMLVRRLLLLQRKKQTIQNRQVEVIPDQTIIRPLLTVEVAVSRQLYPIT